MKKLLIYMINLYRRYISPHKPRTCRFYPTCSEYSIQAIEKYGAVKGSAKSVYRIMRCNPFNPGGYDPVDRNQEDQKDDN